MMYTTCIRINEQDKRTARRGRYISIVLETFMGSTNAEEILNNHLVEEELNERCIFCLNEIGRRIP